MEEVARKENHVHISLLGQAHDFMEGLPTVISTDWISLCIADMVVSCDENADRVRLYGRVSTQNFSDRNRKVRREKNMKQLLPVNLGIVDKTWKQSKQTIC